MARAPDSTPRQIQGNASPISAAICSGNSTYSNAAIAKNGPNGTRAFGPCR